MTHLILGHRTVVCRQRAVDVSQSLTIRAEPSGNDYVRARRYMPAGRTLRGTALEPDYHGTGFFRQGVAHHIVVIKSGDDLFMEIKNLSQRRLFAWKTDKLPDIREGRVGFRQMFTRSSRYSNIKISGLGE